MAEYILTDEGVAVWHNEYFRRLGGGRWRLLKKDGRLVFQLMEPIVRAEANSP